jgi:purine nucleoside permease
VDAHRIGWAAAIVLGVMALWAPVQAAKIPIRVVVVTTFEIGKDTGDVPGEFQNWVIRLPLSRTLPFPAGNRPLRYNADKHVLGIVTGSGSVNSAASIMALGLDPRFDLTHAYWIVAGIAGIDPHTGTVGSAAWAEWVIDRDLTYEIDAREIPSGWSTGLVPLTRSKPFEAPPPAPGIFSPNAYHLNPGLTDWAYHLTADVKLDDTHDLQAIRAGYPDQPEALKPPHVMKGDEVSSMDWWMGALMAKSASDWMAYWTGGKGVSVTTAMEDSGIIRSLQMLAKTGRVNADRVMVLRTASDFSVPAKGQTAAELLASENSPDSATKLSAFIPSLEAAYRVGSKVVDRLSAHWDQYRDHAPGGRSLAQ